MIQGLIDLGQMVLKVLAIILIVAVFAAAIKTLIGLVSIVVFPDVVTELFGLISMYLPFNGLAVFDGFATVLTGVLTFFIAKKIFQLTGWSFSLI